MVLMKRLQVLGSRSETFGPMGGTACADTVALPPLDPPTGPLPRALAPAPTISRGCYFNFSCSVTLHT